MKALLEKILLEKSNRTALVHEFQKLIWDNQSLKGTDKEEILSELAYDLDFYEPDEKLRGQDKSYYGDDVLEQEIKKVLGNL